MMETRKNDGDEKERHVSGGNTMAEIVLGQANKKVLITGNGIVGWAALMAGCEAYFGYPVTPQNEITEWFAKEYPERNKVFVQTHAETASVNMLLGAAAAGARAMTSTSGPGWGLMMEGLSTIAALEFPCVIVNVARGGPGPGTIRQSQQDYFSVTKGGGQGGYRCIVLAPSSVQETHDFLQLAFYLADKYRNPVVVLSDAFIGQMAEFAEIKPIDFGPLPEKTWALRGLDKQKDGRKRSYVGAAYHEMSPEWVYKGSYLDWIDHLDKKYKQISQEEVRSEGSELEDCELVLVAFGHVARACREAVAVAREQGYRVGLLRPITLWPFPTQAIRQLVKPNRKFLVVEDNLGQMVEDVELAVQGKCPVSLVNMLDRDRRSDAGLIVPDRIVQEIKKIMAR
jgi:2-oxoglutarate ferredoxin oxidoreductase subunit alpha